MLLYVRMLPSNTWYLAYVTQQQQMLLYVPSQRVQVCDGEPLRGRKRQRQLAQRAAYAAAGRPQQAGQLCELLAAHAAGAEDAQLLQRRQIRQRRLQQPAARSTFSILRLCTCHHLVIWELQLDPGNKRQRFTAVTTHACAVQC
jgi:hypothetical protein